MLALVDGRLFDSNRLYDELDAAKRLRAAAFLSAPLSFAVIVGALFVSMPWPAMALMILSGIAGGAICVLAHRQADQNVKRIRVDYNMSYYMCRRHIIMGWRDDAFLNEISHWTRMNGVPVRYFVEHREELPYRIHFSFEDDDGKILFRMKWV